MAKQDRTGPAQADKIEQPQERSPTRQKDESRNQQPKDDAPGAKSKGAPAASDDEGD